MGRAKLASTVVALLLLIAMGPASAQEFPDDPYFEFLEKAFKTVNTWRHDVSSLIKMTHMMGEARGVEHDGKHNFYFCLDMMEYIDPYYECDFLGKLSQGNDVLRRFEHFLEDGDYFEKSDNEELHSLRWSDSLALSASNAVNRHDGCNVIDETMASSTPQDLYISDLATYDDHVRVFMYGEYSAWDNHKDAFWDIMIDDSHYNFRNARFLLSDWYDSIGLACDCHKDFGMFCVADLARNLHPIDISRYDDYLAMFEPDDDTFQIETDDYHQL